MQAGQQHSAIEFDRRTDRRRRLFLATTARHGGDVVSVEILDLSAKGLRISTRAPLQVEDEIEVVLVDGAKRRASVARSSGEIHGCRFDKPLSRSQLAANSLRAEPARDLSVQPGTLGQRIHAARVASPYSMEALARRIGVSKSTLWKWETDQVRPRPASLRRLSLELGIGEIVLLHGPAEIAALLPRRVLAEDTGKLSVAELVEKARIEIAAATGVRPDRVRIQIDFS